MKKTGVDRRSCDSFQVNRRKSDFRCTLDGGHGGPHRDPATGTPWGEPKVPRGMRRQKKNA